MTWVKYRQLSQTGRVGPNGVYSKNTDWVTNKKYNHTSGPRVSSAFAGWIKSLGKIDYLRFDGEGDGSFAEMVVKQIDGLDRSSVFCSEFSSELRRQLTGRGIAPTENILVDALIPPVPGGTMVVVANQFLDALPFNVFRRKNKGKVVEELIYRNNDKGGEYSFRAMNYAELNQDADFNASQEDGSFAYSPAKIIYIKNMLSRPGRTILAIIDYQEKKTALDYIQDVDKIPYSPTTSLWLISIAKKMSAKVVYSDFISVWPFARIAGEANEPIGWQTITIIESNVAEDENEYYCKV
jgi:hypothetical protein